jgi:hypothetical protein
MRRAPDLVAAWLATWHRRLSLGARDPGDEREHRPANETCGGGVLETVVRDSGNCIIPHAGAGEKGPGVREEEE